jgi:poly-gamma-glutamate synthase PgsB/CapB
VIWILSALAIGLIVWWVFEYGIHLKNLNAIPIRIHVNGTRGKSSVTRLIAGALRAGGIKTVAKTTGTLARFIHPDGSEEPVVRLGLPNILEQVKIIRRAKELGAQAIVIECMALVPDYQFISEQKIIKSTIGVITNARPDHLDMMGPTELDVADALCNTIPKNGIIFTAEVERFERMKENAEHVGAKIIQSNAGEISREELDGFSYIEHAENVALALEVAKHLGISRDVALNGMQKAEPDFGVLRAFHVNFFDKTTVLYSAFAANDPESTSSLWKMLGLEPSEENPVIVIVNNRADRASRTGQLAKMLAKNVRGNHFLLIGTNTKLLWEEMVRVKMEMSNVLDLGGKNAEEIFEQCMELTPASSRIIGVGNIGGVGKDVVNYFEARSIHRKKDDTADAV